MAKVKAGKAGKNKREDEDVVSETEEESSKKVKKVKKGKLKEVLHDSAPLIAYGKGLTAPLKIPGFDVDVELDAIERKLGTGSLGLGGDNEGRMSTGMLVYDLILGGGLVPGWYTNFGKEQSCKSTSTMTMTASAVNEGIPIIAVYDYDGCYPDYVTVDIDGKSVPMSDLVKDIVVPEHVSFIQKEVEVDTVGGKARGIVYYGGRHDVTRLTMEDGGTMDGYRHPMLVKEASGLILWKYIEDVQEGEVIYKRRASQQTYS
jgi:hypothetical protein